MAGDTKVLVVLLAVLTEFDGKFKERECFTQFTCTHTCHSLMK